MPIMYVNPAPKGARRAKQVRRVKRISRVGNVGSTSRRRKGAAKRKTAASRRANKKKGNKMARKLFGAAAKAHAKRLAKLHRKRKRKNPARKRRHARRRRRNPANTAAFRAGYEKTFGPKRKRRKARKAAAVAPKRRRKTRRKARKATRSIEARRAAARRRYHRKHPGAKRRHGVRTLRKARRAIKRAYRFGGRARAYARRHHMRTNPRRARRRRRNPGLMSAPNMVMGAVKAALPVAASLYLTRFIIAKVGPSIPMVDRLGVFQRPAVAGLMVVAANYATKTKMLSKYRAGVMLGVSLNLVDTLIQSFAPAGVKSMFGLGDSGIYDQAMGEFVTVGDYLEIGDEPIDDDITLSDYVETSGVEEELGALQEELGVEEELGGMGPRKLGGVSQTSMMKALKQSSSVGVVPQRSFVKQVPHAGAGYDNPASLYTGIFGGGW